MRRGLMGWTPDELPQAALAARSRTLHAAMERERLDACLLYTNLVRPSAVSWLTGFTPYWIDSILLVRREGAPVLATALSKRVADWIRSTSWLDEIINTPKPGTAIGQRLATAGCKRVGVLELDGFPAGFYDDLAAAAPAAEFVDATATFAAGRRSIDAAERKSDRTCRRDRARGARRGRRRGAPTMPARSRVWSRSTPALPPPRRPISPSRPILRPTGGSCACRGRCRSGRCSRCAPRSPTREAGSAAPARLQGCRGRPCDRARRRLARPGRALARCRRAARHATRARSEGTPGRRTQGFHGGKLHWQLSARSRCRFEFAGQRPRRRAEAFSCSRSNLRSTACPGSAPRPPSSRHPSSTI